MKKIIGIIILLGGIVMILISQYIKHQVVEGQGKAATAQSKLDAGMELFSVDPLTKEIGQGFTAPAQKRIDQGRRDIAHYEHTAKWLQIGGIILVIVGIGVMFFGRKKN